MVARPIETEAGTTKKCWPQGLDHGLDIKG